MQAALAHTMGCSDSVRGSTAVPRSTDGPRCCLCGFNGAQILLSLVTYELVRDHLPRGAELRDLGEHRLKDLIRPEHIFQLTAARPARRLPAPEDAGQPPQQPARAAHGSIGGSGRWLRWGSSVRRPEVRLVTTYRSRGHGQDPPPPAGGRRPAR